MPATMTPIRIAKNKADNRMKRMPIHEALPAIGTLLPTSQEQSPLFGLPAELRVRIYEYVFGSGTVHVRIRHCKPSSRHLLREDWDVPEAGELAVDVATKWSDVTECSKLSYAICEHPDQWDESYQLSRKIEEDTARLNDDVGSSAPRDRARDHYSYAHSDCTNMIEYFATALEFKQISRSFPNLKRLCISNEACMPLRGSEQEWRTFFNVDTLETVEIMMGSNRADANQKAWFAWKCDLQEKFLVKPSTEEEKVERADYAKIIGKMPKCGVKMDYHS